MSSVGIKSGFGINPFSLGALVIALVVWSADVSHLSLEQATVISIPGTALGALGVRWAVRKDDQRKWLAWTAFGLNFAVTLPAFIWLLAYAVGFRPG